ncbi:hypothetical protein MYX82_14365 [Acidobacteria bacterium AH-259-D05]|nr:hypothetical protein [Acidobacteria bacterium AH-259-D05]
MTRKRSNRVKLQRQELIEHLREQISFMLNSAEAFDRGASQEAKRLAHQLRLLLHDTRSSKSLLGQLGLKKHRFLNTANEYDPNNLIGHVGLLAFKFNNSLGYRPWVVPGGESETKPPKRIPYEVWWNMPVVVIHKKTKHIRFCRRDIILHVADTDGGSHVDDALEKDYVALTKWNAIGIATKQK